MWNVAEKTTVVYSLHLEGGDPRYIGISCQPNSRVSHHRANARAGMDLPVYRWMRKHGVDSIKWTILEAFETRAEAVAREIDLIASLPNLLNVTAGGEGSLGVPHTEEWKRAHSERLTGRKRVTPMSSTERENRRLANLGRKASEETRAKMSVSAMGKSISVEARRVISEKAIQRHADLRARGEAHPGHTPEANAKRSESLRRSWAARKAKMEG